MLLLFLVMLLPLQFVWAAAAPYCQHEQAVTQHIGHHEHKHQRSKGANVMDGKSADVGQFGASLDPDCGYCQYNVSKSVVSDLPRVAIADVLFPHPLVGQTPPSCDPDSIDRPNWPRLA